MIAGTPVTRTEKGVAWGMGCHFLRIKGRCIKTDVWLGRLSLRYWSHQGVEAEGDPCLGWELFSALGLLPWSLLSGKGALAGR